MTNASWGYYSAIIGAFLSSAFFFADSRLAQGAEGYNYTPYNSSTRQTGRGTADGSGSRIELDSNTHRVVAVELANQCGIVTNDSGRSIFFPTKSDLEVAAFFSNAPNNIPSLSIQSCGYQATSWSDWGACSATCGGGTQTRTRQCYYATGAEVTGSTCDSGCGGCSETQACNTQTCDIALPDPVVSDPAPAGQESAPTGFCFFHVSGGLIGANFIEGWYSEIGVVDDYSEMVGPGSYPNVSSVFVRSNATTFDAMAFGKNTHVTLYSGLNFTGSLLVDEDGPTVINNYIWIGLEPLGGSWITETWPSTFQAQFPSSTRRWSTTNMHPWGYGTSLKVTCK